MSNAAPDVGPGAEVEPTAFAANLDRILKVLLQWREMSAEQLAAAIGMPRSTFYEQRKKGSFQGVDLLKIAEVLGVHISTLYMPADELVAAELRSRCSAALSSVPLPPGVHKLRLFDDEGEPLYGEPPSVAAV